MTTPSVTFTTWNVNSVRSRLPHLLEWLRSDSAPDVLLLQELKTVEENFPAMEIEELGYNLALLGQKTYNGVGILSRFPLSDIRRGLPGNEADEQARYIEAVVEAHGEVIRVASVYVPNGQAVDSDKFVYKMGFFDHLEAHLKQLLAQDEKLVIGGDYNVAPFPLDVYDPKRLDGTVCYHPREREKLRRLLNLGFYDAFRVLHPTKQQFSWWDYRGNSLKLNHGMRIDHLLLSPQATDCLSASETITWLRDKEQASDHAPVTCTLQLAQTHKLFA